MSLRRTLATGTSALALSVLLAACGSQLDPDTVAAANGSSVNMGAGSVSGEVLPDGTVVGGGGSAAGGGGDVTGSGSGDSGSVTGGGGGGTGGSDTTGGSGGDTAAKDPVLSSKGVDCSGFKNQTGITDDKIILSNVSDLSGPVPGIFQATSDAVRAFAIYFNAQSDICGRSIEVLALDSRADAGADQQAYQKACEQSFAAVGSMSAFDSGGARVAEGCGLPDLRTASVTPERTACKTCFGTQSAHADYFQNSVPDFIKKNYPEGAKKGAYLYLNAGAAAVNGKAQISAMSKRGINYVYTQGVDVSEFNYGPYVQQMKDKGVQYVQWLGSYQHGVRLAEAMQQSGFEPDLFLFDPVAYNQGFVESGKESVDGATVFLNFVPFEEASSSQEMSLYLSYLRQVDPNSTPTFFGVFAWSAARLFVTKAVELGGDLNRANMIKQITGVKTWDGNKMHAPQSVGSKALAECWRFMQLKGGKWTPSFGKTYQCTGKTGA